MSLSIQSKSEIIVALTEKINSVCKYIDALDQSLFEATPENKWSAGQILEHLLRSIKPLQPAYSLPPFLLRFIVGVSNRPARTYDEVVAKYKAKLAAAGKAPDRFVPPVIAFEQKALLIKTYQQQKEKLVKNIQRRSDRVLDKYVLPHPLMGKITMREMLFFTIYHNEHHLLQLKNR